MTQENQDRSLLKYFTGIVKEIGLTGFIIVVVVFVFLIYGTAEQKREFIDRFILLKHVSSSNPFNCIIVVLFLVAIITIGGIYYNLIFNLRKKENNRIGKEKSKLQEQLTGRNLRSSD